MRGSPSRAILVERGSGPHKLGQTDEVAALAERTRPLAPILRHAGAREQHVERTHAAHSDDVSLKARRLKRARHEQQDLRVRLKAFGADKLNAKLRELARLAGERIALAQDRGVVPQAQRRLAAAQARRHHARDGKRHVGTRHEQGPVGVKETKRHVARGVGVLEQVAHLKQGRLNGEVARLGKARAHRRTDLLAPKGLFGKHVPEPARGGCRSRETHRFSSSKCAGALPRPCRACFRQRQAVLM